MSCSEIPTEKSELIRSDCIFTSNLHPLRIPHSGKISGEQRQIQRKPSSAPSAFSNSIWIQKPPRLRHHSPTSPVVIAMKLFLLVLAIISTAFALTTLEMKDRMAFHDEPSEAMSDAAYNRYLQEVAAQIYFRHNRAALNAQAYAAGRGPLY